MHIFTENLPIKINKKKVLLTEFYLTETSNDI